MATRRHWSPKDFAVTSTGAAYDGKGGDNRFGYCRKCGGDMQSFAHNGKNGPIHHHNSHKASGRKLVNGLQVALRR